MRRFSQRNSLVTLSDINITPLLDLAFVLLIIFVITTPLLEQGMDVRPPEGGRASSRIDRENIKVVEIDQTGRYMMDRETISLDTLEQRLVQAYQANKELIVRIRADRESLTRHLYPVIDRCTRNGITKLSLATEAPSSR